MPSSLVALLESYRQFIIARQIQLFPLIGFAFIALIGNTISIAVFLTKEFRKKSTGTFFIIHGIFETLYLLINVGVLTRTVYFPNYVLDCQITKVLLYTFETSTFLLQAANSVDRTILITMPSRENLRKLKFQIMVVVVIVLASAGMSVPPLFQTVQIYILGQAVCAARNIPNFFLYYLGSAIFVLVIPFIIMFACSIIMIVVLRRKGEFNKTDQRKYRSKQLTRTLLASNILFLAILLPQAVYVLSVWYLQTYQPKYYNANQGIYLIINGVTTNSIYLYHASTFFVHLKFNKLFRKVVKEFCQSRFMKKKV